MKNLKLFIPIEKVDVEKREVWGQAVAEVADKAGEIFDYETSVPLFRAWSAEFEKTTDGKSLGNIRAMHGKVAAGKVISFAPDDASKSIPIGTKIVDENEWQKVLEGVYTGFSIGGSYAKKWKDPANASLTRYTAAPSEISLVDNPCVPTATFSMIKANGSAEAKPFQRYGVLKALVDDKGLTNGELFKLASDYLPEPQLTELAKANVSMGDVRAALVKLATEIPAPAPVPVVPPVPVAVPAAKAEKKALKILGLAKSLYSVADLADCLRTIAYIATDTQWEAEYEKDGSAIPAALRTWLAGGIEIFKQMSVEEADELLVSITPNEGPDKNAPATLTKADIAKAITDLLAQAPDPAEPLAKFVAADAFTKIADLEKANGALTVERDALSKQLTELAAGTASLLEERKGSLRVVDKSGDVADLGKRDDPNATPTDVQAEFKKSFQRPQLVTSRAVAKT